MRKHFTQALAIAVLALALGSSLAAHAKVEKTLPAANSTVTTPPDSVQVWFSEAPDLKVSKIDVKGPAGPVKLTGLHVMDKTSLMATLVDATTDGAYTVSWQAAGDDGHLQKGEFTFSLKRAK